MSGVSAMRRSWTRLVTMIGFGQITAPMLAAGPVLVGQVRLSAAQTRDKMPHLQLFGFQSVPPVGSDVVTVSHAGDASNTVIIASGHQTWRLTNLGDGESAISDMYGNVVHMSAGGIIVTGNVIMTGNLAVTGNVTATGGVTAGFGGGDSVTLQHHEHPGDDTPPTPGT